MRAKHLLFVCLAVGFTACAFGEETVIPKGYTQERYERIWRKSPFTVASVIAASPADTSSFTDNLSLVGLMTIGNKPLVTVVSTDSQETQLIDADKPNAAGLQIVSFINDLDPKKVEVVLKKNGLSGTLHFVINETPAPPPEAVQNSGNQAPRIPLPRTTIQQRNGVRPTPQNVPGQPSAIIRRRAITLPGANRPNTAPQRTNPPRSNAIPPP